MNFERVKVRKRCLGNSIPKKSLVIKLIDVGVIHHNQNSALCDLLCALSGKKNHHKVHKEISTRFTSFKINNQNLETE
jgi:hypothetical protein